MKKLLLSALVALLFALPAYAQSRNDATIWRPATTLTKASTSTSGALSSTVSSGIFVVRVIGTADFHVAIGITPQTATTTGSILIPAYTPEYFAVVPGQAIAVIRSTADGTVYVTEMTR